MSPSTLRWVIVVLGLVAVWTFVKAYSEYESAWSQPGRGTSALLGRQPLRMTIGESQPTEVPSTGYVEYHFVLPRRSCMVTGRLLGISGANKDFQAFLMGDDDFINWKTNHQARAFLQTGKVAAATIEARLNGPGTFHLVISNVFSLSTSKTVAVQGQVECP